VFTGIWETQQPHLCVPEITYVGLYANPSYVALQKCTKSTHVSIQTLLYLVHTSSALGYACMRMGHVTFVLLILRRFLKESRIVHIVWMSVCMQSETEKLCSYRRNVCLYAVWNWEAVFISSECLFVCSLKLRSCVHIVGMSVCMQSETEKLCSYRRNVCLYAVWNWEAVFISSECLFVCSLELRSCVYMVFYWI
jgi:hypothetical protein